MSTEKNYAHRLACILLDEKTWFGDNPLTSLFSKLSPNFDLYNNSASSVRDHLTSIGSADDITDIQLISSRFNNDTRAFCVTLNSIAFEKRAYKSQWPDQVVVKPYRAPRQKSYKQNQMNNTNQHRNNSSNSKWNKTKYQPSNYYQEQPRHVQSLMQSQFRQPLVQQPTSLPWGGIYPGYNGQFMPLMNLPNTI